jgi:hypothetical protein
MKPIDILNRNILNLENANFFLSEMEYENFLKFNETEKEELLKNLLEKPINKFTEINELYFRSKWAELVNKDYGNNPISILEVASGDADMIPQSLAKSNPGTTYIAANMNKILNVSLLRKTKDLNIKMKLIADDAAIIKRYIKENSVDIIAFQHGVNDILQAILCEQNDIDTINSDWMECLPKMIELLQNELSNNSFEKSVKKPFINLMNDLLAILKEDGVIAINHYMFQLDLDLGYPKDLFENLIPIIREWFKENNCFKEVYYNGFDSHWWIFLKHNI